MAKLPNDNEDSKMHSVHIMYAYVCWTVVSLPVILELKSLLPDDSFVITVTSLLILDSIC
jgi:hypothetical protein